MQPSATTSSPHHANLYHGQHQQTSQKQPMYNINSLSEVNIPISNSQQMLGKFINQGFSFRVDEIITRLNVIGKNYLF